MAASAVPWQAYDNTHTLGPDTALAPNALVYVEGYFGLQYFPNGITKPLSTANIQPKPTLIPSKNLVLIPASTSGASISIPSSGTSVIPADTYVSGISGKVPVRLNKTKTQKFPVYQSKPSVLKPVTFLKPPSIVLPLPTLLPVAPEKPVPSTIIVNDITHQVEQRILYYTNIERANAGKPALQWDDQLAVIGRDDCVDMAARGFFDHINPDGETPADRAVRHGYHVEKDFGTYVRVGVGENIAMLSNYPGTPDELARFIVDAWMNSPGHRANIIDSNDQNFTVIGVGVAYDQATDTWYAAQEFF
ncbi:MAG: CAP domain-containing protein [Methanomicrobiales archaeon]